MRMMGPRGHLYGERMSLGPMSPGMKFIHFRYRYRTPATDIANNTR